MGLTTGLLLAGTAMSMYGQIQSGQRQAEAEEYNAQIAEQQATSATLRGKTQADLDRRRGESFISTQRARYGASGVTFRGSPLEVMAQTAEDIEYDALMTEWEAKTKASYYSAEAENRRRAGKRAVTDSYIGAGMTLLTSAASYGLNQGVGGVGTKISPQRGAKYGMGKFNWNTGIRTI